jgi:hypothetical protein
LSALKEYRSKGEQKMTVQHVHVAEGGQAIVGKVNAPAEGGRDARKKWRTTSCSAGLCTRRCDAARNRSGAGYGAKLRRFGDLASAECTAPVAALLEETRTPLSTAASPPRQSRHSLSSTCELSGRLDHRIATLNAEFVALVRSDAAAQRLMTIPGIGVLNATALVAAVGDAMVLGVLGHPLFASVF